MASFMLSSFHALQIRADEDDPLQQADITSGNSLHGILTDVALQKEDGLDPDDEVTSETEIYDRSLRFRLCREVLNEAMDAARCRNYAEINAVLITISYGHDLKRYVRELEQGRLDLSEPTTCTLMKRELN